ncbi:MAG: hypothetical protein ACFFDF_15775 [Candidatus Odinarchaeota archaeon]
MSSVLYQIKHNIMEKLGIREFQGLIKSYHILKEILSGNGVMVKAKIVPQEKSI